MIALVVLSGFGEYAMRVHERIQNPAIIFYEQSSKVNMSTKPTYMDPGMDGLDTYKKILELHPEQKAIIASGFSETGRVKEVQNLGAGAYIRKPLLLEKIGIAVKEELEK